MYLLKFGKQTPLKLSIPMRKLGIDLHTIEIEKFENGVNLMEFSGLNICSLEL